MTAKSEDRQVNISYSQISHLISIINLKVCLPTLSKLFFTIWINELQQNWLTNIYVKNISNWKYNFTINQMEKYPLKYFNFEI